MSDDDHMADNLLLYFTGVCRYRRIQWYCRIQVFLFCS